MDAVFEWQYETGAQEQLRKDKKRFSLILRNKLGLSQEDAEKFVEEWLPSDSLKAYRQIE